jgi:hypothetical protein
MSEALGPCDTAAEVETATPRPPLSPARGELAASPQAS